MINYTKEQKQAIDYFDTNLLIAASAGSGKTQVLLEKVVKLIENDVDINQILMVTFTNLAASEMKSKLENMLLEKQNGNNSNKFFDALNKINACDISTLHSFCQKLVREYYYLLNVDPSFEIKEEAFISSLKNNAFSETIKYYLDKKDEEFIKISNLFVFKREYSVFKEEILKFYEFLISKQNKYQFIKNLIEENYNLNFNENILISKFKEFVESKLNVYGDELQNIRIKAKQINSTKLEEIASVFYGKTINCFNDNITFMKFCLNKIDFPQVRIKNNAEMEETNLKEELQALAKKIKAEIGVLNNIFDFVNLNELSYSVNESKTILKKFIEIIQKFEENFLLLKKKNNCLDFNDLEALTLQLFENENILDEIALRYKYVFVDEYQDTNSVQEEILKKVSKYSKMIMVGDLKQSIYAFRECNPKIFSDKLISYSNQNNGKVIYLNKNFRSRKTILDFSNTIFSNLMREENANLNYSLNGKFIPGVENIDIENSLKPVEVLCVDKTNIKKDDEVDSETILILNSIYNLLNQKVLDKGVERNLTYKDIAIISRKRSDKLKELCKEFDKHKIPYSFKYNEKIYKSFEIKLILAYLKILNNIENEISLYSVLQNIYKFTTNELITIKSNTLFEGLKNYNKNDEVKVKINKFFKDFNEIKQNLSEFNIKELIEYVIKKLNIDLILMKLNGKLALERINVFLSNISSNNCGLSEFLTLCGEFEDKKFEIKKVVSENSITIDTFHSTKGLEYNAVIIIDAGDSIFSRTSSNLIYNAKFGIGIYDFNEDEKTKKPNIVHSMVKELNKQEEFNEEVRLSYVAFTRAKNFMVIIGKEKLNNLQKESTPVNFLNFNSYLSLIFANEFDDDNISLKILDSTNDIFEKQVTEKENIEQNIELDYAKFNFIKNKEYGYNASTQLQLKNSVTSLTEEDKAIYNISNFKITDNDEEDFIELGNCYHKALEKLPLNLKTVNEVKNKMQELIELKSVPANIYDYVDDQKLFNAISAVAKLIEKDNTINKEHVFMCYVPYSNVSKSDIQDKILIQGIVDLYIEKENEIILIDYKTSRLNDYNVIKKYDKQLRLYELALKERYKNKTVKKFIYSIFLDKLINIV